MLNSKHNQISNGLTKKKKWWNAYTEASFYNIVVSVEEIKSSEW